MDEGGDGDGDAGAGNAAIPAAATTPSTASTSSAGSARAGSNSTEVRFAIISASASTSLARDLTSIALVSSRSRALAASFARYTDAMNARNARNFNALVRAPNLVSAAAAARAASRVTRRHSRTHAGRRALLARAVAPRATRASRSRSADADAARPRHSANARRITELGVIVDAALGDRPDAGVHLWEAREARRKVGARQHVGFAEGERHDRRRAKRARDEQRDLAEARAVGERRHLRAAGDDGDGSLPQEEDLVPRVPLLDREVARREHD